MTQSSLILGLFLVTVRLFKVHTLSTPTPMVHSLNTVALVTGGLLTAVAASSLAAVVAIVVAPSTGVQWSTEMVYNVCTQLYTAHNPWLLLVSSSQVRAYTRRLLYKTPVPAYLRL